MVQCLHHHYVDRVTRAGSASAVTVYLAEIPEGQALGYATITACVYTTLLGDYNTAKYINIGIERNGIKHYIFGRDIGANHLVVRNDSNIHIPSGWRPFAEIEGTATSTTYEVCVFGVLHSTTEGVS